MKNNLYFPVHTHEKNLFTNWHKIVTIKLKTMRGSVIKVLDPTKRKYNSMKSGDNKMFCKIWKISSENV